MKKFISSLLLSVVAFGTSASTEVYEDSFKTSDWYIITQEYGGYLQSGPGGGIDGYNCDTGCVYLQPGYTMGQYYTAVLDVIEYSTYSPTEYDNNVMGFDLNFSYMFDTTNIPVEFLRNVCIGDDGHIDSWVDRCHMVYPDNIEGMFHYITSSVSVDTIYVNSTGTFNTSMHIGNEEIGSEVLLYEVVTKPLTISEYDHVMSSITASGPSQADFDALQADLDTDIQIITNNITEQKRKQAITDANQNTANQTADRKTLADAKHYADAAASREAKKINNSLLLQIQKLENRIAVLEGK